MVESSFQWEPSTFSSSDSLVTWFHELAYSPLFSKYPKQIHYKNVRQILHVLRGMDTVAAANYIRYWSNRKGRCNVCVVNNVTHGDHEYIVRKIAWTNALALIIVAAFWRQCRAVWATADIVKLHQFVLKVAGICHYFLKCYCSSHALHNIYHLLFLFPKSRNTKP